MEITREQIDHIQKVLDQEGINSLKQTISEWFPKHLVKTEDGYPIFKGDSFFVVNEGFILIEYFNADSINTSMTGQVLFFKKRSSAMEYIRLNEPKYSLLEVRKAINNGCMGSLNASDVEDLLRSKNK